MRAVELLKLASSSLNHYGFTNGSHVLEVRRFGTLNLSQASGPLIVYFFFAFNSPKSPRIYTAVTQPPAIMYSMDQYGSL